MDKGLLRRLAVLCKDYHTLSTIDDLFVYAGAEDGWCVDPSQGYGSQRMVRFYGWVEGIEARVPERANSIILKLAADIAANTNIPEGIRNAIGRELATAQPTTPEAIGIQIEPLLSTLVRLLANDGHAREVAIVAYAKTKIEFVGTDRDWNCDVDWYNLYLQIPPKLYGQVAAERDSSQKRILDYGRRIVETVLDEGIREVIISPMLVPDDRWRDKAIAWLAGEGVNNQGHVRSSNVAPLSADGLLFRSPPEIELYKALKATGVSFAPLPVFVRGGTDYRRIEPDFVVLKDGVVMIIEVDGDTVHQETPAEAHARTTMLAHEGAHVERVKASECDTREKAAACAKRLLQVLAKLKDARR